MSDVAGESEQTAGKGAGQGREFGIVAVAGGRGSLRLEGGETVEGHGDCMVICVEDFVEYVGDFAVDFAVDFVVLVPGLRGALAMAHECTSFVTVLGAYSTGAVESETGV